MLFNGFCADENATLDGVDGVMRRIDAEATTLRSLITSIFVR